MTIANSVRPRPEAGMSEKSAGEQYLFTSESVSMGHPDKVADQVSDALLDSLLEHDPRARAAIETMVTTGLVVVAGEVTVHNTQAECALGRAEDTIRKTIASIGYDDSATGFDHHSCAVLRALHGQSPDISQGVTKGPGPNAEQGAGDQGLMFGYACNETAVLMPMSIHLSHRLMERHAQVRQSNGIPWLRPDAKSQVTVLYEGRMPKAIDTIVFSTQHTEAAVDPRTQNISQDACREIIEKILRPVVEQEAPGLWSDQITFHINPTGRFVIGGPHGDSGLTGRKIIVDTYGGRGRHGGGAFSGKDPSKVDRSAAYMARHIAKNIVAAELAEECEVQLAYAIGVAEPVSVLVSTFGSGRVPDTALQKAVREVFPLTPGRIIQYLNLLRPIYRKTAIHGHFGRTDADFTWEATNRAKDVAAAAKA